MRRSGPRLRFLLGGALGLGAFTLLGSVSPSFWLYAAVLIPVGLASITFLNSCNTSIQLSVEPQFRGRVLALYLAILRPTNGDDMLVVGYSNSPRKFDAGLSDARDLAHRISYP